MKKPFCDSCGNEITDALIFETDCKTRLELTCTLLAKRKHDYLIVRAFPVWQNYYDGDDTAGPTGAPPEICRACFTKQLQKLIELNHPTSVAK